MKLGFVTAILPELSLAEVMRFAAETGYDCVEVMCWPVGKAERRYAGVTHIDVAQVETGEVQALIAETGVEISGLGYYPNLLSPNPEEAETCLRHLEAVIDAAPKIGVRQVNTFIGRDPSKSVDQNWPRFLEVWKPLIQRAEDRGVRIGIENCPMYRSEEHV